MAVDGFFQVLDQADGLVVNLPQIRRLRVCLLGGDSCLSTVGKADLASALLRGLTADQPGTSDPVLDLAFDYGVFERAWRELLVTPTQDGDFRPLGMWPFGLLA